MVFFLFPNFMLCENHVIGDMSFEKFIKICNECWKDRYGFIVIDKESDLNKGRYSWCGIDKYININYEYKYW